MWPPSSLGGFDSVLGLWFGGFPARPFFAGGRLIGLLKPNGSTRPIVIGESLRRLIGRVLVVQKKEAMEHHFAPARARAPADPVPPGVEAAQLGVGIEGGLEELVHGVTVALQR